MIARRHRARRWRGADPKERTAMWFWAAIAAMLLVILALMIASKDQPANGSLEIWSSELMVAPKSQALDG